MPTWGNDITLVRPVNDHGDQRQCLGYLYVNGMQVHIDEMEINLNPEEVSIVTIKMLVENLRIVSENDLEKETPIMLNTRRRIVLRRGKLIDVPILP